MCTLKIEIVTLPTLVTTNETGGRASCLKNATNWRKLRRNRTRADVSNSSRRSRDRNVGIREVVCEVDTENIPTRSHRRPRSPTTPSVRQIVVTMFLARNGIDHASRWNNRLGGAPRCSSDGTLSSPAPYGPATRGVFTRTTFLRRRRGERDGRKTVRGGGWVPRHVPARETRREVHVARTHDEK